MTYDEDFGYLQNTNKLSACKSNSYADALILDRIDAVLRSECELSFQVKNKSLNDV